MPERGPRSFGSVILAPFFLSLLLTRLCSHLPHSVCCCCVHCQYSPLTLLPAPGSSKPSLPAATSCASVFLFPRAATKAFLDYRFSKDRLPPLSVRPCEVVSSQRLLTFLLADLRLILVQYLVVSCIFLKPSIACSGTFSGLERTGFRERARYRSEFGSENEPRLVLFLRRLPGFPDEPFFPPTSEPLRSQVYSSSGATRDLLSYPHLLVQCKTFEPTRCAS